jgi:hypothetical protein
MRRVTQDELGFYDGLATRINNLLGDPACALTQSSLAQRIGWHRVSLCNFLNRIDKSIAAHFIPKIAQTFRLTVDELMGTAAATGAAARCSWDPRADDAEALIEKLSEWRDRNLADVRLHGHLPPVLLPRRGMVANYVCSVFDDGFPDAAERWHDVIDAEAQLVAERGEGDVVHIMARSDLLRFSDLEFPFQRFSTEEVVYALEMLKKNWVRHRGFALVVVEDPALSPEAKLELASSNGIVAVGREVRVEYGNDFRVRWTEDAEAVSSTNDCLLRLKKAAGFGARERPTIRQVEEVIDELLRRVDGGRPAVRLPRKASSWEDLLRDVPPHGQIATGWHGPGGTSGPHTSCADPRNRRPPPALWELPRHQDPAGTAVA